MEKNKILAFKNLVVQFQVRGKIFNTIRAVDFDIFDNELIAIVGESGSGKSVLTKTISSMLDENGFVKRGSVKYYPTQEARDDVESNFREPIDFIDLHKAILSISSRKKFTNVTRKKLKKLNKEMVNLDKIVVSKIDSKLYSLNEKLVNKQEKLTNFNSKNQSTDKLKKLKNKIKRNVYLKKIALDEDFKNKQILAIKLKIDQLENDLIRYMPLNDVKKALLKRTGDMYRNFLSNDVLDESLVNELTQSYKELDFLYDWEKEILSLNKSLLEKKPNKDEMYVIANKADVLCINNKFAKKRIGNRNMARLRGATVATIPQDPMTSLNPLLSVGKQISEVLRKHEKLTKKEARERAIELLEEVGISNAAKRYKDIPGEYSGGMRQRVVIAIALACKPRILICDEPTTALDVTVQAIILKLIKSLQDKHKFTTIFITHDLGVVANISDRVAVMYAGQIIEYGKTKEIYYNPQHPYTWALLSSLPQLGHKGDNLFTISGNPPSLQNVIYGDAFAPRNEFALNIDYISEAPLFEVSKTHFARTWLLDKRSPNIKLPKKIAELKNKFKGE